MVSHGFHLWQNSGLEIERWGVSSQSRKFLCNPFPCQPIAFMRETHRASLTRPLGRAGEGPLPTGRTGGGSPIFFNTEDTDLTENHPAHFDNTDAASRQLMTRNLRTHITSLYEFPTARASPAPWGGLGRGLFPWGGLGRGLFPREGPVEGLHLREIKT